MKLSEMRQTLNERGLQLTRSLGQSFLHDGNQIRRIVAAAELQPTDRVLEIGPGLGPLTDVLLAQPVDVLAVELDRRLVDALRERLGAHPRLRLVHADALEYLRAQPHDWTGWKLVANLPYSVASTILVELAQAEKPPDRLVNTVQLEVAHRIFTGPDTADYGVMTLLIQLRYEPRDWFKIPPECFFPAPDVASACVCLHRRPAELLSATERRVFVRLVKRAFSQRRKMMFKLLKQEWPEARLAAAFAQLEIPLPERAEKLGLEKFTQLARFLHEKV